MEQQVPVTSQKMALISAGQRIVALPIPFRYVFIAVIVVIVVWHWRSRGGAFHAATQRGGWRLAIAVVSSIGMLAFGVGIALGQLMIGVAGFIVGGLPAAALLVEGRRSSRNSR
jgi:hypothetical protein